MERWEYNVCVLYADANNTRSKEFLQRNFPTWKPTRYYVGSLIPELDEYGEKGWELVSIEPVLVYEDGRVQNGDYTSKTSEYLCAWKRRLAV